VSPRDGGKLPLRADGKKKIVPEGGEERVFGEGVECKKWKNKSQKGETKTAKWATWVSGKRGMDGAVENLNQGGRHKK